MEILATGLGDYIDGGSFAASIDCGKALGANYKLLYRFERKLHHGSTNSVVFIVDAIDRDVHVTSARSVNAEDRDAILGWIVRVHRLRTRRQIS